MVALTVLDVPFCLVVLLVAEKEFTVTFEKFVKLAIIGNDVLRGSAALLFIDTLLRCLHSSRLLFIRPKRTHAVRKLLRVTRQRAAAAVTSKTRRCATKMWNEFLVNKKMR